MVSGGRRVAQPGTRAKVSPAAAPIEYRCVVRLWRTFFERVQHVQYVWVPWSEEDEVGRQTEVGQQEQSQVKEEVA